MRAVRWFIRITATIILVALLGIAAVGIVIGTEKGTRWALGVVAGYAPGELVLAGPSGSLLGGLTLERLDWQNETTAISAEQVLLNIDLLPLLRRRLDVHALAMERFELRLPEPDPDAEEGEPLAVGLPIDIGIADARIAAIAILRGESSYAIRDTAFAATLEGPRLTASRLTAAAFGLVFDIEGRVRLAGEMPVRLSGQWRQADGAEPGLAGSARLAGQDNVFTVQHDLSAPVAVASQGSLRVADEGLVFDVVNTWNEIRREIGGRELVTPGGTLVTRGTLDALAVELETRARYGDYPATDIRLAGVTDLESIRIDSLLLDNDLTRADIDGSASLVPDPNADIAFRLTGLDPARLRPGVEGELAAEGTAAIRLPASGLEVDLRIAALDGTFEGHAVAANGSVDIRPEGIEVPAAELRLGGNAVSASGRLDERVNLTARLELDAIGELLPAAAGSAVVDVELAGPRDAPAGVISVTGTGLGYGTAAVETASVTVRGSLASHTITGTLYAYETDIEVEAAGSLEAGGWAGEARRLALARDGLGRWTTKQPAAVSVGPDAVRVDELCFLRDSDGTESCADVDYRREGRSEFTASIAGLPVTALPFVAPAGVTVTGTIGAQARGTLENGLLNAAAELTAAGASVSASYEGEETRVAFDEVAATATVTDNRLASSLSISLGEDAGGLTGELNVADLAAADAPIDGRASVSLRDAAIFDVFLPAIANPRGTIGGTIEFSGTRAAPEFVGDIRLSDGSFAVRPAGITVTEVTLRAQQLGPGRLRVTGDARSGEGRVSVTANTMFATDTGMRSEVRLEGENFELLRQPDWRVSASPRIDILFDERTAIVTGSLAIPQADIRVQTIPETAVRPTPDAVVHTAGEMGQQTGRHIEIDVDTTLGKDVRFEGFGLTTNLAGAVRVQGGSQQPYLGFGQVDLEGGRYEAYGQDLTIEQGRLIFNGPLASPTLDIRATRRVDSVVAGIHVTGRPAQLRSTVFSEPAMSDAETLSYLLTGRPLSSATTSAEGDILNTAAFALGMSQAGSIAAQIGGALGLETLSVEGGAEDGRIVAGKRIGGRLFVEYGYGLIDKLGTLLLRYQINNRLMLESRTGTVSNLDIVYSVKKQ